MKRLRICVLVVAGVISAGCSGPPVPDSDVAGVRSAIDALRAAVNSGDAGAFAELTTDDFEVFPPSAEPRDREAARAVFRQMFAESSPSLEPFTNEQIEVDSSLAVQRYSFRLTLQPKAGGAATTETGSGLHVWRRGTDGHWRLAKDIYTVPAAP